VPLSTAPTVISSYFALDAERDVDGVTALFAADATVVDERETHHGSAAIRAWRAGPASRYEYTTEVSRTEPAGPDHYVVTARLTGNFPGNSVELRHDFTIAGEEITRLVITP
jgi:ketosteroid isomerase-like protein